MTGARDLVTSERGAWCIGVVLIALALVILGNLTGPEWVAFAGSVTAYLVASKTASGYIESKAPKG